MAPDEAWTSPSELADYAYCPRSHWYRNHPPAVGPSAASEARSQRGVRLHERRLGAERRRAERGRAYWVGLLIGVVLITGGLVWALRP
jgi:hypothetical protein